MRSSPRKSGLPRGLGTLFVYPAKPTGPDRKLFGIDQPHCRLADGRTVVWNPPNPNRGVTSSSAPGGYAVDCERLDQAFPPRVASLLGCAGPAAVMLWTRLEAVAKVSRIPAHLLLCGAVPIPAIPTVSLRVGDLAVTLASPDLPYCSSDSTQEGTHALR